MNSFQVFLGPVCFFPLHHVRPVLVSFRSPRRSSPSGAYTS